MNYTEEYLSHAAECRRMAENSKLPCDKDAWLRLAKSWLDLLGGARRAEGNGEGKGGVGTNDGRPSSV